MRLKKKSQHSLPYLIVILVILACCRYFALHVLPLAAALFVTAANAQQATSRTPVGAAEQIGGQKVVRLQRKSTGNGSRPEFLSAVILPGRGMNLFQITAIIPRKGEIPVLASPSLEEAARRLNGGPEDVHGVRSFAFGSAFLVPYPNRIRGMLSADCKTITTHWNGKTLTLPAVWKGKANPNAELHAIHGLILDRKTDAVKVETIAGGQKITGMIHAGNFGGYWLSKTDLTISISLASASVETIVTAKNVGNEAEPLSIAWHPYFAIPSGDRRQARLHIPASQMAEVNNYDDVFPTGKLVPVSGTQYDFSAPEGKPLDDIFLDDNFAHLTRSAGRVVVDIIDPASAYGIRVSGLSPEIKTLQVYAPPDKPFVVVEDQFNFADPFSKVWNNMDTGMITLQPNQSVVWKVRLELLARAK
jgi:aldose 1-epimerase